MAKQTRKTQAAVAPQRKWSERFAELAGRVDTILDELHKAAGSMPQDAAYQRVQGARVELGKVGAEVQEAATAAATEEAAAG